MREVNFLPGASDFGHTSDRKLHFSVYYTPRGRFAREQGDLAPTALPTISGESNTGRPGASQGGSMKPLRVLALIQLLILGIMLTAAGTSGNTAAQGSLPTAAARPGWQWPLAGEPAILTPFDKPEQKWLAGHRGVDLRAAEDTSVLAPHRGKVAFRSTVVDRPVLVIDHGSGFVTSLEPVSSELAAGAWIEAGDNVGTVATGAHCSKRCLHWGVRFDGEYIDPALLIRDLRPSILLPLH